MRTSVTNVTYVFYASAEQFEVETFLFLLLQQKSAMPAQCSTGSQRVYDVFKITESEKRYIM